MESQTRTLRKGLIKSYDRRVIVTWATGLALFAVFALGMAWIQFSTPNLPDNDGYYHIRFAALMRELGWKPDFPYLPLTILNPREFYDHHFLFHVALIPFTTGDLRLGAKWASVVFSSLAFTGVWWLLRGQHVPYPALWSLGLMAVSQAFLYRMSITRVQSLSLLVLVIGLHWMLQRRYSLLAGLGFFYVWMYDAFPLLPLVAVLYMVAAWLVGDRPEWRRPDGRGLRWQPVAWSLLGVVVGLLVNPYFPYDLVFIFRHLLPKLTEATAVNVGSEWYPYDTQQLLENSGPALLIFFSGVLALGLRGERMETRTAASLLIALAFGLMLLQARRFVEYFPASALIFAAFAWKPFLERWRVKLLASPNPEAARERFEGSPGKISAILQGQLTRLLPAWVMLALVLFGVSLTLPAARAAVRTAKPYELFEGAAAWLKANTPPGARVFQTDWDDFPRLFYYNTHNTYLVGLDPTYMQIYDPQRYDLWVETTQGDVADLSVVVPARFGARYIVSDLNHRDFISQAEDDPGLVEVYRDDNAVVFAIP